MTNSILVAVCDDEIYYRKRIHELLERYRHEKELIFKIDEYASGTELLKVSEGLGDYYHIIFMDVDMPDMQGTDAARVLREQNSSAAFCFVTAYEQYAYEAFRVEALDYIVKPLDYAQITRFLDKALAWKKMEWERVEAEKRYLNL